MKILLLGAAGQVGWELQRSLAVVGKVVACTREHADFEDLASLASVIQSESPDVIVNAAAYTAVDQAEDEKEKAFRINGDAVLTIAEQAKALKAWLVHYSTDYVFAGEGIRPYTETDRTEPRSVYGASKLQGERAIRETKAKNLIFRTSWVYSLIGRNFPNTILRLAREKDELHVVSDQIGAPTSAALIADVTASCLYRIKMNISNEDEMQGVYHLAPLGHVSWHGFAIYLIGKALEYGAIFRAKPENIYPIATADYKTAADRPLNSRLNVDKIRSKFKLELPDWKHHADEYVRNLLVARSG